MKKNIVQKLALIVLMLLVVQTAFSQSSKGTTTALIKTDLGNIKILLYDNTPVHRDNFIKLAKEGFYDGTIFHRVIDKFMIQGGDGSTKSGGESVNYTLPAEILPGNFHKKGALAAARIGDKVNPQRRSSGSQFYIVQGNVYTNEQLDMFEKKLNTVITNEQREAYTTIGGTPHLDAQYTVFGEVLEGLDVVDKIAAVKTQANKPVNEIKMTIEILKK